MPDLENLFVFPRRSTQPHNTKLQMLLCHFGDCNNDICFAYSSVAFIDHNASNQLCWADACIEITRLERVAVCHLLDYPVQENERSKACHPILAVTRTPEWQGCQTDQPILTVTKGVSFSMTAKRYRRFTVAYIFSEDLWCTEKDALVPEMPDF